jgi:tetracycline resistance efflux pump
MDYGALALVPPLVVIVLAIVLRASFEALLMGCIVGFIIIGFHDGTNFFTNFIDTFYKVMEDESTVWVILVCGLYGSLIGLMVRSGGALKFGEDMLRYIKTKKAALFGTWLLGLFIFLDDYLSALTVGITMKKITDHFKIPREYLAYIVNTTSPPWCVIVPLSTWTLFIGSVLEKSNFATAGQGNHVYFSVIPFVAYGWVSVLLIPLTIAGIIPLFGRMKKASVRAEQTGATVPEMSKIASLKMEHFETRKKPSASFFILPLSVTLLATFFFNYDALKGIMIGVAFTFIYYLIIRLGTFQQISETVFTGFGSMLFALALVVISYILKEVGDKMGLTQYVIGGVKPLVSKELLPFLIFVSISLITFTTGSSWGVYAVVIPIVIPLAQSIGSNVLMSIGAVVSAGVFGANACLYSDATILTSQSTDLNNLTHSLSQLPFALLAFALTALSYLGMGYLM